MILFKKNLKKKLYQLLKQKYPIEIDDLDLSYPPDIKIGDFALSFPFKKALRCIKLF